MGVLSDFISAPPGAGHAIGESVRPADHWNLLEGWKGIDPIKIATLHSLIAAESLEVDSIVSKSGSFELVGGDAADGPWVMEFPDQIVQDVASLDSSKFETTAIAWAQTEEMILDGFTPAEASTFVSDLSNLCRSALADSNKVFLWISL